MAEFLNQQAEPELDPMNEMGKPLGPNARSRGYEHCKAMGLSPARAFECVNTVSEHLERDEPHSALNEGMKFLDLTGMYRLFAVILTAAVAENKKE